MVVRTESLSLKDRHQKAGPILAISAAGTVTKANLPARRALAGDKPIEQQNLGSVLAGVMAGSGSYPQHVVLQLPRTDGSPHEVLMVLSDQEPAPPARETPSPEAPREAEGSSARVADFIAHELRNRLGIILGLSQILEANFDNIEASERHSALRSIQVESEQALMIIEGLLKVAEGRRKETSAPDEVPLHAVIHRVVTEHKRRYPDRTFEVTGDAPVFAAGDSTRIQIAIANLISNAEKVTPRDQSIQVNIRQEGNHVAILVLDRGKALSQPLYTQLWDIYSKGVPEGVEVSGTGIGLAICKELVGSMGGRVWAGPRLHGGSVFAISLQGIAA